MPVNKFELIRSQSGMDWSKETVPEAAMDDLDPEAVSYARIMFSQRPGDGKAPNEILSGLSDIDVLDKAGLCIEGKITRAALLLLGKPESASYFDGFTPGITWTLYCADNTVRAYEHFDMPFLLAADKVCAKIRNEKYRYLADPKSLFPEEVREYDEDLVREVINNCIAHSDYRRLGKINVEEFEDHLVFISEGSFIPETVEQALEPGYRPPYYRNAFLYRSMVSMRMIDPDTMGIPGIYEIQKKRCFPLPSYDLDVPDRVRVTIYGRVLSKNYTHILHSNRDMDLRTVFLLDQIQKQKTINREDCKMLKKKGLAGGRYPHLFIRVITD